MAREKIDFSTERVSQAEFGRLVGVSRARINQLIREGLLVDDGGLLLIQSLKDYWGFRTFKRHYNGGVPEYFEQYAPTI